MSKFEWDFSGSKQSLPVDVSKEGTVVTLQFGKSTRRFTTASGLPRAVTFVESKEQLRAIINRELGGVYGVYKPETMEPSLEELERLLFAK